MYKSLYGQVFSLGEHLVVFLSNTGNVCLASQVMYNFALLSAMYECSSCSASFPIFDIGSFKILDNLVDISETSFDFNLHFTDDL